MTTTPQNDKALQLVALLDDTAHALYAETEAARSAQQRAEQQLHDLGLHLSHCNFGENSGCCKYGPEDACPALTEQWRWLGQAIDRGAGHASAAYMPAAVHQRVVDALTSAVAYFNLLAQQQTLGLDERTDNVRQQLCVVASILTGEVVVGNLTRTEETRAAMRQAAALAYTREPDGEHD